MNSELFQIVKEEKYSMGIGNAKLFEAVILYRLDGLSNSYSIDNSLRLESVQELQQLRDKINKVLETLE